MQQNNTAGSFVLGLFIFLGLTVTGYLLGQAAMDFKEYERSVTVKGLSEREYEADIVIWPLQFTAASNDIAEMYRSIDDSTQKIRAFLEAASIGREHIFVTGEAKNAPIYRIDYRN